jgi:hypothetical protein
MHGDVQKYLLRCLNGYTMLRKPGDPAVLFSISACSVSYTTNRAAFFTC